MEGQRQRSGGGRRRRRKARAEARASIEPAVIVARRPNSPHIANGGAKPAIAASAAPQAEVRAGSHPATIDPMAARPTPPPRRSARIVQLSTDSADDVERQRQRLLARLMASEGRGAISRAASEYRSAGFSFPEEQDVQLQLLESFDEEQAREAVHVLARLLAREAPIKRPVLEQRLRRLEEYGDEAQTRETAAELRRHLRA